MKILRRLAIAGSFALFCAAANAQGYPSKPITVTVPFGPGSAICWSELAAVFAFGIVR